MKNETKRQKKSTKYKSGFSNLLAESFMSAETAVSKCRLILERILKFNKRLERTCDSGNCSGSYDDCSLDEDICTNNRENSFSTKDHICHIEMKKR